VDFRGGLIAQLERRIPQLVLVLFVFPGKFRFFRVGFRANKKKKKKTKTKKKKKRDARAHRAASMYKTCVVSFRARNVDKMEHLYSSILQTTLYTHVKISKSQISNR
tara:strand:+ start:475 stop:795 length:321 start_codon:yes stop_codon:yes gene_type:complete